MIDEHLQNAGIAADDIETRLDGQNGKTLLITKRELLYFDQAGLQKAKLREIVNVKTAKTGELNVRSPNEALIEGSIKGFDLSELKFFFEAVKGAIARAKTSVTGSEMPPARAAEPAPPPEPIATPPIADAPLAATDWDDVPTVTTSSDAWAAPQAAAADWDSPASGAWTPEKQTFEIPPDLPNRNRVSDSWADLEAELNPTKSGSMPGLLNPSAMIPAPAPVFPPAKDAIDPFADLARNAAQKVSGDNWGAPPAPINVKASDSGVSATGIMVPSSASGEWSGEIMDASTALDTKAPKEAKNNNNVRQVRLGDQSGSMEIVARWLRILSLIFAASCAFLSAALLVAAKFEPSLTEWAMIFAAFFLGLLLPMIGWGIAALLSNWVSASKDLRSIRKATLGH